MPPWRTLPWTSWLLRAARALSSSGAAWRRPARGRSRGAAARRRQGSVPNLHGVKRCGHGKRRPPECRRDMGNEPLDAKLLRPTEAVEKELLMPVRSLRATPGRGAFKIVRTTTARPRAEHVLPGRRAPEVN